MLLEKTGVMEELKLRLEKYFDEFIIDEIQDIAGRDFSFLEQLMTANMNMLFVGDFYQHTYDTSRDGNANKNLFENIDSYEARFTSKGFFSDNSDAVFKYNLAQLRAMEKSLLLNRFQSVIDFYRVHIDTMGKRTFGDGFQKWREDDLL